MQIVHFLSPSVSCYYGNVNVLTQAHCLYVRLAAGTAAKTFYVLFERS